MAHSPERCGFSLADRRYEFCPSSDLTSSVRIHPLLARPVPMAQPNRTGHRSTGYTPEYRSYGLHRHGEPPKLCTKHSSDLTRIPTRYLRVYRSHRRRYALHVIARWPALCLLVYSTEYKRLAPRWVLSGVPAPPPPLPAAPGRLATRFLHDGNASSSHARSGSGPRCTAYRAVAMHQRAASPCQRGPEPCPRAGR